ncbi:CBS domain-containing membrane protein [Halopseudomonas litoralis]|uniref:CBS domain-containing membrane protein n=1 Tax=Halopseudomonas litoralis TaxID=797277 RepID=A0A1H1TX78_9GAMM|nr:CBS domain-containing protein [Halopseudomonas litoralis]SDS64840.1 CBS domain-containing membrane protein [Halopseudomonas litoralis]
MSGRLLTLSRRLFGWLPRTIQTRPGEWLRAATGVGVAVACTFWLSDLLYGNNTAMILLGPAGASAVLLFVVSSGALAQPWPVLGSYLLAGVIGIAALHLPLPPLPLSWLLVGAVASVVLGMSLLRCLHPPACALVLVVVLAGDLLRPLGGWLLLPVMLNACCLLFCATLYNNLTGVRYPKQMPRADLHHTRDILPGQRVGFTEEDLDRALDQFGSFVDITRHDLEQIIRDTESSALRRKMGDIRAEQIMSRDIRTVGPDTTVMQAIRIFRHHHVKTLPVVDSEGVVQGITSLGDLLAQLDLPMGRMLPTRINLWRDQPLHKVMTTPVVTVDGQTHVVDMIPLMSNQGLHCLPVLDNGQLVGLVTQTDVIAALHRDLVSHLA